VRRLIATLLGLVSTVLLLAAFTGPSPESNSWPRNAVKLTPCHVEGVKQELRCGTYEVFENRKTQTGRKLPLKIVVIPARHPHPDQGPVFYMAGGPGETATELTDLVVSWGDADEHDVVIVDERGTGEGHRLDCKSPGSDDNLEAYLNGPFDAASARACRDELQKKYDLTQYTTPNFADDIDEIRAAMGYDKLVTLADRVPLYHARSAQEGLDQLFEECDEDTACHAAYPRLREDFAALLKRTYDQPVSTIIRHPVTGARTEIHLSERAFADAVRVMMYHNAQEVPFLIERAAAGDFAPFAEAGLRANRDIYTGGTMGLHYCITCNEFVSRIRPDEIDSATSGSYLGSWRVRAQMAACQEWSKTELPADYFEPFRLETPAVVVSGAADPASRPPNDREIVKSYLPDAIQLVVPDATHTPENQCTRSIRHQLYRTGTTKGLDTQCIAKIRPPPFKLPGK